ncbi:MauE/DoxX family redox-associated membrane protein [Microbacterium testaceum]|uniref:MauE/DoxX family redox-associated membrane protein n=1 Tax=Microbacterium testaceum TaxID=2033 RepID=UPI001243BB74|nr:MauE/DoxX family redox-associated membrane protein [Microbacterium testaceum]
MNPLTLCLLVVAAPFLVSSGVAKLVALDDAPRTLSALRVPVRPARTVVAAVSLTEIALGLALLTLDGQARLLAATATALLLAGFTVLTARAVARGSVEECGCFGRWNRTPVSGALVRRNSLLALGALILTTASAASSTAHEPAAVAVLVSDPVEVALAVATGWGLLLVGAFAARAGVRGALPAADILHRRPPLIREDGLVFDVVTEAVRGRGQLLLFGQPLCGRCERAVDLLDQNADALGAFLDVRVVYAVGPGVDWNAPARTADGPRTPSALDLGGQLAQALDIGSERPVAVLIATSGRPVPPYAVGETEIAQLVDALVASRV